MGIGTEAGAWLGSRSRRLNDSLRLAIPALKASIKSAHCTRWRLRGGCAVSRLLLVVVVVVVVAGALVAMVLAMVLAAAVAVVLAVVAWLEDDGGDGVDTGGSALAAATGLRDVFLPSRALSNLSFCARDSARHPCVCSGVSCCEYHGQSASHIVLWLCCTDGRLTPLLTAARNCSICCSTASFANAAEANILEYSHSLPHSITHCLSDTSPSNYFGL